MIHPTTVVAPSILASFIEHCARVGESPSELLAADLDPGLLAQVCYPTEAEVVLLDEDARMRAFDLRRAWQRAREPEQQTAGELHYGRWIHFEVIAFAWQGGDALHYGHLVMAEELSPLDWTAVSFAPSDDCVSWLGDDSAAALANLMATANHQYADEEDAVELSSRRAAVTAALRLPVGQVLRSGARTGVRVTPVVPPGYRFVEASRGLGVMAPARSFASLDPASVPFEALEDRARAALAEGHPATALQLFARIRIEADKEGERAACEQMIPVYEALGRPIMARRVEAHLRVSNFE